MIESVTSSRADMQIMGFIALFVWSLRLRRRAYLEINDIDRMREEYRDEPEPDMKTL
jgi:hypothetical protein